ncbi:MAG: TlpA disulfide reductase family protein [Candidatus Zixiibacteriota bacterium]
MTEKSGSWKAQLWSIVLLIVVLAMAIEIFLLVKENRKLLAALSAPRGPFKILNPAERVPPFAGIDLSGKEVKVEYPSSQKTVLFWFSVGCPSCEHNLEFWKEVCRKYNSAKFRFFGATNSEAKETDEFAKKFQLEFPIVMVSDQSLLEKYKVEVIPQTMLIDANGVVLKVWPGPLSDSYKKEIEEMLSSSP